MGQTNQYKPGILLPNTANPLPKLYASVYSSGNRPSVGTYTFTGSGFGTKSSTAYFENFESHSLGAVGGNVGQIVISNNTGLSITTNRARSGTKSLINASYAANDFPKPYIQLSGTRSRVYACCWIYITGDVTASNIWKMWRIGSGAEYGGTPRAGESWSHSVSGLPSGFGGEIVNSLDGIPSSYWQQNDAEPNAETVYVKDQWLFTECEFNAGTLNNSDAYMRVAVNGVNVLLWQNRPYLNTSYPNLPTWILLPCQGIDGVPACSVNWDSVYVDESNARIIFTDNATYALSTPNKRDVQPITFYSDELINADKNTPSFASGETAHAHLYKNDGSYLYLGTKVA